MKKESKKTLGVLFGIGFLMISVFVVSDLSVSKVFALDTGGSSGGGQGCGGCGDRGGDRGGASPDSRGNDREIIRYCTNGATNYPACNNNNQCVPKGSQTRNVSCPTGQSGTIVQERNHSCPSNAWSSWRTISNTCQQNICTNGATNFPYCNNNVCTNGATNFPYCNDNVCSNGATNYPYCNNNCTQLAPETHTVSCGYGQTGYITKTRYHSCPANSWSSWTETGNTCQTTYNYCTNGATNYPYCNNQQPVCQNGYVMLNGYCQQYNYYQYDYLNYNYSNYNNYCDISVSTTGATPLTTTATIYGYVKACGNTTVWFDYGTNYNLNWQSNRETTSYNGQIGSSLSGLTCGTRYYYRAVAQSGNNTKYGQTLSFTTPACYTQVTYNYDYYVPKYVAPKVIYKAPVKKTYTKGNVPVPEINVIGSTKTEKGSCLCESDYMRVNIDAMETALVSGKVANFKVTYKNVGTETLKNVIVRVTLPDEMTVYSADTGQFTQGGKTVMVTMPSLARDEEGTFIVSGLVGNGLAVGRQVLVNAYANYTVPTVVKSGKPLNSEVSAYVLTITSDSSQNNGGTVTNKIGDVVTSDQSWLPTNALEWIVSIIALIAFILVVRFIVVSFRTNA